jgi:DNA invertase Pin-like site-specific DNA recombinase
MDTSTATANDDDRGHRTVRARDDLERQREGIAKAKSEGKYKGRAPTARAKAAQAGALRAEGLGATEIAKRLKIGRASVTGC